MPRKSSIKTLPKAVLARLNAQLGDGTRTLDELVEWLDEEGHPRSRSSIHRHAQGLEKVQAKLRQAREMTEALTKELGDAAAQGKQGRLLVEMSRTLVFDLLMQIQDEDGDGAGINTKDVALLGKGLAEMARALRLDQDFETKIRDQVAKEAERKLSDAVQDAEAAGEKGLSAERLAQLRRDFLGVREAK